MEDKQIYTSARSEEIKRQLVALGKKVGGYIDTFKEKQKKAKAEKEAKKGEEKVKPAPKKIEEKPQNIQIKTYSYQPDKYYKTRRSQKWTRTKSREETLYSVFVYILFAIIVFIIALSIYLSYFKK